ncbi:MAG: glycoside hydrolase family 13 protein, partial [Actinobacteria bacterium]|nr:glycoside hydrolase family 13 protein [Actinomycetota bacterium]
MISRKPARGPVTAQTQTVAAATRGNVTNNDAAGPVHAAGPRAGWWRHAVIYHVYPRSFVDSNGDGIGDLPGITTRLGYIAALGADAVWLSPFYPSPLADGGYDVAGYCDVDPLSGTLADFDSLLRRAHQLGLRVLVDLVPNHTSDQHPWFQAALAARPGALARDWYIFRAGRGSGGQQPPNNWTSVFGGPAWTRVSDLTGRPDDTGQWYLHLFDSRQPDLNWDLTAVREAFSDILRFWLDRGVDGFRVDAAHGLVKPPGLPDWHGQAPTATADVPAPRPGGDGAGADPGPMFDQDGVHDIYRDWNRLLARYEGNRVLIGEATIEPPERLARYTRPGGLHLVFNYPYMRAPWNAAALREVITASLRASHAAGGAPATWFLSSHDVIRRASLLGLPGTGRSPFGIGRDDQQPDAALGLRRARAAALLTLALPGSACIYQGEELGLPEHTTLDDALRQDPAWTRSGHIQRGRDGCRVPLPWAPRTPGFGFSPAGKTWLPQPPDWASYAVDTQDGAAGSTLELYR